MAGGDPLGEALGFERGFRASGEDTSAIPAVSKPAAMACRAIQSSSSSLHSAISLTYLKAKAPQNLLPLTAGLESHPFKTTQDKLRSYTHLQSGDVYK